MKNTPHIPLLSLLFFLLMPTVSKAQTAEKDTAALLSLPEDKAYLSFDKPKFVETAQAIDHARSAMVQHPQIIFNGHEIQIRADYEQIEEYGWERFKTNIIKYVLKALHDMKAVDGGVKVQRGAVEKWGTVQEYRMGWSTP